MLFIFGSDFHFFDKFPRIGFPATLQICIHQKFHGVELVAFVTHMSGSGIPAGGNRGQIGINIFLP